MAASSLFIKRIKSKFVQQFIQVRNGYIVLLPEVSSENQHPLFKNNLPDFDEITQEKCVNTFGKYLLNFESTVNNIENNIMAGSNGEKKTDEIFDSILEPLEQATSSFDTTWGLLKTLYLTDEKMMPQKNYSPLNYRARSARATKYNSYHVYNELKKLDISQTTEEEQRVVHKFIIEGKLNGLNLKGDDKLVFNDHTQKLQDEKNTFLKKYTISSRQYKHLIQDPYIVKDFPDELKEAMSYDKSNINKGPWEVNLDYTIYDKFMKYCPDRKLRWNTWLAKREVGSNLNENVELRTSTVLEAIRSYRRKIASLLGYKNYVELSMETKMAGSVENVMETFNELLTRDDAVRLNIYLQKLLILFSEVLMTISF